MGHAASYAAWRREPPGRRPRCSMRIDAGAARAIAVGALAAGDGWQPYETAASILRAYGIPVLPTVTVGGAGRAVAAADRVGYPVAMKAADPDLVHKSDIGAVRLGLADAGAVRVRVRGSSLAPRGAEPPVLVQPMVAGTVELVAGVVHDRLFGSLVMVGLGGVHTDLLGDRAFRLVPMTDRDAGRMWRSLRSAPTADRLSRGRCAVRHRRRSRTCCCDWAGSRRTCPRSPSSTSTRSSPARTA